MDIPNTKGHGHEIQGQGEFPRVKVKLSHMNAQGDALLNGG